MTKPTAKEIQEAFRTAAKWEALREGSPDLRHSPVVVFAAYCRELVEALREIKAQVDDRLEPSLSGDCGIGCADSVLVDRATDAIESAYMPVLAKAPKED